LIDTSKIISGKLPITLAEVDLCALMQQVADTMRPMIEEKGLALHMELDHETGPVSGDRIRLVQVFSHLLSNAIKFTPCGGRIEVHLKRKAKRHISRSLTQERVSNVTFCPLFSIAFDRVIVL
jgi:signal transduction histidine kinase